MAVSFFTRNSLLGGLAPVLVGAGVATANPADLGPTLQVSFAINDGPLVQMLSPANGSGGGAYYYEGQLVDPVTGLALSFNFDGDPHAALVGNVNLPNDLDETIAVYVEVVFPYSKPLPQESELRAVVYVGLTTGVGGGILHSQPPYLWQTLIDGVPAGPAASLFFDPFFMSHSGPASSSSSADFGLTQPVIGPPVMESIGIELNFTLSELDIASITSELGVVGCPADFNGDGEVGIGDLAIVLGTWGPCGGSPCPGDADGDGEVGISDFLALLGAWGACP